MNKMIEEISNPFAKSKGNKKEITLKSVLKNIDSKQRNVLLELVKQKPDLQVQHFIKIPKQWVSLNDFDKFIPYLARNNNIVNHREILKDEIIIDVDSDKKEYGVLHLLVLERKWNNLKYRREQWDSGGDGFHAHFKLKSLNYFAEADLPDAKKDIIKHLCDGFMFMFIEKNTGRYVFSNIKRRSDNLELVSHICLVNKKLIQCEWAHHRKGGNKKPFTVDLGFGEKALIEGSTPHIPKSVYEYIELKKERRKRLRELNQWSNKAIDSKSIPPCIRFYLGEEINGLKFVDLKDGTKRAMFHIISYYSHTKEREELVNFIEDWLKKIGLSDVAKDSHGTIMSRGFIYAIIKSNKGLVGCRARHELIEEIGAEDICKNCRYKSI